MGLRDFKMPKLKFKKMKMDIDKELHEIDYEKIEPQPVKKRNKPYEDMANYKTVKEFFLRSIEKYADEPCILEKPDHKVPYQIKTYKE